MKHSSVGSLEALIKEHDQQNDPELLAKWPEYLAEESDAVDLDDDEQDEE